MNSARAALIAILFSLGAVLIIASANAQSRSATPTTSAPVGQIPEEVPPNWKANGWDQSSWTAFREHCRVIFDHPGKFFHHEWVTCANVSVAFSSLPEPPLTPTTSAPVGSIPEKIPPNWAANGSDQASWTALREDCRAVFAKPNKFDHSEWEGCVHLSSAFSALPEPPLTPSLPPLAAAPGSPTPMPTPLPPAPPGT